MQTRSSLVGLMTTVTVCAALLACAKGSESLGTGGSAGTTTSTSQGGGDTGGSGGTGGTGTGGSESTSTGTGGTGTGGAGGTTTSTGGAGGTGGTGGTGGGAPMPPTTLFAAFGGGSSTIASVTDIPTNMGFATPWQEQTDDAIGLAVTGSGTGLCVIRAKPMGELRYAIWNGQWSPGFGQPLTPLIAGLNAAAGPSLAASQSKGHLVFQGEDLKYYYGEVMFGLWMPKNELVTNSGKDATGPAAPAITVLADTPILAYVGDDGDLYDQAREAGAWQPAASHGVAGQAEAVTPAIAALAQGPELLIVYTEAATNALYSTARTAGVWSAPAEIAGAASADPVSLAPLAVGGAVLAYRGMDNHLYTAQLAADGMTWSAPVVGVMGSDPVLVSPPVVAKGAQGADAELLYLDTAYVVYWSRLQSGAFGPGSFFNTASARIAAATGL